MRCFWLYRKKNGPWPLSHPCSGDPSSSAFSSQYPKWEAGPTQKRTGFPAHYMWAKAVKQEGPQCLRVLTPLQSVNDTSHTVPALADESSLVTSTFLPKSNHFSPSSLLLPRIKSCILSPARSCPLSALSTQGSLVFLKHIRSYLPSALKPSKGLAVTLGGGNPNSFPGLAGPAW